MNREIKFRVWNKRRAKFEYFDILTAYLHERAIQTYGVKTQQFTGLLDKNGTEIYEGDIVSMLGNKHEVFFRDGSFMYWIDKVSYLELSQSCCLNSCEVVGNIVENPSLSK